MPTHDIIDNRNQKLVDQIKRILDSSEAAHFAVGYFFLSGFTAIAERLTNIKELRLLIGNTTNRETIEQIAQGYRRLELIEDKIEAQKYPKRSEEKRMASETVANIRSSIELMDQTDEAETLVKNLVQMIEEKRLHVRVYTKGTLHAKAYIFDYGTVYDNKGKALQRSEKGIAIVGSSNLTLSGITHNTELNVVIHGNDNHRELTLWFDELWDEAEDFNAALMQEMKQSWAGTHVRPYDVYMKTLYSLVKDRLEDTASKDLIIEDEIIKQLADFQKVAVNHAVRNIRDYDGAFVSDVVGLGKSFIGAAIVKRFEQTERARPLIICPAPLIEMWERYNEVYQLNARVLSMGMLKEDEGDVKTLLNDFRFKDRDFVLIDESHNLRNKSRVVGRFAPNANKEYKFKPGESELNTLIATDILAEGLNLQDGDLIINYDLHWNPVKLIQRFGRIDRIGSDKDVIYGYNFLPELGIERNLGLKQKLKNRIQEIHDTIGEDAAILDTTEQLNEEAMYAIYEQQGKQLSLFDVDDEEFLDLNEAEEILRKLQKEDLAEFERIANLPHGIRTAQFSMQKGTFVFCEASDPNRPDIKGYQQLFLLNDKGEIISRDIPRILGAIKATDTTPTSKIPVSHNSTVTRVKQQFAEEVKHRQAEREFNQRLTQGQRYIIRELRVFFKSVADEEIKTQVNILEKAFRLSVNQAVNRELNKLRRDGFTGKELFNQLVLIYRQHNMHELQDNNLPTLSQPISFIVCSEGLV